MSVNDCTITKFSTTREPNSVAYCVNLVQYILSLKHRESVRVVRKIYWHDSASMITLGTFHDNKTFAYLAVFYLVWLSNLSS